MFLFVQYLSLELKHLVLSLCRGKERSETGSLILNEEDVVCILEDTHSIPTFTLFSNLLKVASNFPSISLPPWPLGEPMSPSNFKVDEYIFWRGCFP